MPSTLRYGRLYTCLVISAERMLGVEVTTHDASERVARLRKHAPNTLQDWQSYDVTDLLETAVTKCRRRLESKPIPTIIVQDQQLIVSESLTSPIMQRFWKRWAFEVMRYCLKLSEYTLTYEEADEVGFHLVARKAVETDALQLTIRRSPHGTLTLEWMGASTEEHIERELDLLLMYADRLVFRVQIMEQTPIRAWMREPVINIFSGHAPGKA